MIRRCSLSREDVVMTRCGTDSKMPALLANMHKPVDAI